jgi:hypothetical protein
VKTEFIEKRRAPRVNLGQMVRIRPFDPALPPEYCTTANISDSGLYFTTRASHYAPGVNVYVTADALPGSPIDRDLTGAVVRIDKLDGELYGVAIQILSGTKRGK